MNINLVKKRDKRRMIIGTTALFHSGKRYAYNGTLDSILMEIASRTGVMIDDLKSKNRSHYLTEARYFYFVRAKQLTNSSLSQIGKLVNCHHSTVVYGIKLINECQQLRDKYKKLF